MRCGLLLLPFTLIFGSPACVRVDVDVPEACVTSAGLTIPGAYGEQLPAELVVPAKRIPVDASVTLTSIELAASDALAKIDRFQLSIDGAVLASCTAGTCEIDESVDLASLMKNGELRMKLTVEGELPEEDFTADVTTCFA